MNMNSNYKQNKRKEEEERKMNRERNKQNEILDCYYALRAGMFYRFIQANAFYLSESLSL
jgi:hypothetical protein